MIEKVFNAETTVLPELIGMVESALEQRDCPMKAVMQISVSVEEIFVNIASYAYPEGGGTMTLRMETEPDSIRLTFIDSGIPFNPLEREDPDVTLSAEERTIGGLGIYMVRQIMDETDYRYENGQNVLTVFKRF